MIQIEEKKTYEINSEAEFPEMFSLLTIETGNNRDRILRVWAEYKLEYNQNNRTDSSTWEKDLEATRNQQRLPTSPLQFAGGSLSYRVGIRIKYFNNGIIKVEYSNWYNNSIIAIQPSKQRIRDQHPSLEFHALTFYFSKFVQFNNEGHPNFNDGFGLSKLQNPSVEELWNWKTNILNLRDQFSKRFEEANMYPSVLRETQSEIYADLIDLDEMQVYIEVFQSYGNGKYFKPVRNPETAVWSWIKNEESDSYADPIIQIFKSVKQGNFPEGWND